MLGIPRYIALNKMMEYGQERALSDPATHHRPPGVHGVEHTTLPDPTHVDLTHL